MRRNLLPNMLSVTAALGLVCGSLAGCGGGESTAAGKPQSSNSGAQASPNAAPADPIARVVF
ncbi:MAG: hypothetical protein AAF961_19815, partial [Planctomycetota bacterium]